MKYGFMEMIYEVLKNSKSPLSASEIWETAENNKLTDKLGSSGKTPVRTLAARLYTDLKNENSKFVQVSKRPAKFYLKGTEYTVNEDREKIETKYSERCLHKLLSSFVRSNSDFKCLTKTIFHEKSKKTDKGKNEWLHPDIVGVYYPFDDFTAETLKLYKVVKENPYKLFSFEIKKILNFANLRECYFQAVSNSSWANEGYLVTVEMEEDTSFLDELRRLNNSFGIGIIKLNPYNISQSDIVFSAKEKKNLDWDTIDRLTFENSDFKDFISDIALDAADNDKRLRGIYDDFFEDDEATELYAKSKGIIY